MTKFTQQITLVNWYSVAKLHRSSFFTTWFIVSFFIFLEIEVEVIDLDTT